MSKDTVNPETQSSPRKRKAPVTLVGILLLLQAVFLFALFPALVVINFIQRPEAHLVMFFTPDKHFILPRVELESPDTLDILFHFPHDTVSVPGKIVTGLVFFWLSTPALLAGFLFLSGWRHAWSLSLLVQVVLLGLSLIIYFKFRHPYVYLVMLYSIFMVFYLNHYEIQQTFRYRRRESLEDSQ